MKRELQDHYSLEGLLDILQDLRGPEGCPWARDQDYDSLKVTLRDETQEVLDAVENRDMENLQEELGDLLLQVLFYADLAREDGYFTLDDVMTGLGRKLVRRHPHVFGDAKADTPEEALALWREVKRREREEGYR